ncbi:MAG: hypothetical protein OEX08_00765 [Candidatus Nomurabacteria bacterium]|nr:hypothetical protein [Candidatus Nomurabacteria bacterium]
MTKKITLITTGILTAVFVFVFSLAISNFSALRSLLSSGVFRGFEKIKLFITFMVPSGNVTTLNYILTIIISILLGVQIAILVNYIKKRRTSSTALAGSTHGVAGFTSGILGMGCAACGSVVITSIFGTTGGILLSSLPLHGAEFLLLSIVIIAISTIWLIKKNNQPLVCDTTDTDVVL